MFLHNSFWNIDDKTYCMWWYSINENRVIYVWNNDDFLNWSIRWLFVIPIWLWNCINYDKKSKKWPLHLIKKYKSNNLWRWKYPRWTCWFSLCDSILEVNNFWKITYYIDLLSLADSLLWLLSNLMSLRLNFWTSCKYCGGGGALAKEIVHGLFMCSSKDPHFSLCKPQFSLAWAFCSGLVPSGPKCVSARRDRLNKQTSKQTNKQTDK